MSLFSKPPESSKPDNSRAAYWVFGAMAAVFLVLRIREGVESDPLMTALWAALLVANIVQLWRTRTKP